MYVCSSFVAKQQVEALMMIIDVNYIRQARKQQATGKSRFTGEKVALYMIRKSIEKRQHDAHMFGSEKNSLRKKTFFFRDIRFCHAIKNC